MRNFIRDFEYLKDPIFHIPVTFLKRAVFGGTPYWRQYFWNKWGFLNKEVTQKRRTERSIWINAISGGEVTQAVSLCRKLRDSLNDTAMVLSTDSEDAYRFAESIKMTEYIIDAPWDIPSVTRRCIKKLEPKVIIFIENAYYPVLLSEAKRAGVKNILISARMNKNMMKGHILFKRAARERFFKYIDMIGAKTKEDKDNYIEMGCEPDKIHVLGDLKYDLDYIRLRESESVALKKEMGFNAEDTIFTAGSVHDVEFELVLEAYKRSKEKIPGLKMIFVPRWFYDVDKLKTRIKEIGFKWALRSELKGRSDFNVLILDSFGELPKIYGISDVVYIGNSIIPINERGAGHNIIEPLAHGKPILFGEHMNFWRDVTRPMKRIFPGCEVKDAYELSVRIIELIENKEPRETLKVFGLKVSEERSGAVDRYLKLLKGYI